MAYIARRSLMPILTLRYVARVGSILTRPEADEMAKTYECGTDTVIKFKKRQSEAQRIHKKEFCCLRQRQQQKYRSTE